MGLYIKLRDDHTGHRMGRHNKTQDEDEIKNMTIRVTAQQSL